MYVHNLKIENFRGIQWCEWSPPPGLVCLVGAGDSTKSTVLDAISLCLSSRWNVEFGDADFYLCDPDRTIRIEVTLANLSTHLESVDAFGWHLRGIDSEGGITDEPHGQSTAITILLTVDRSLEPEWHVVASDQDADPSRMTAQQRQHLGVLRISDDLEHHLRWARGSALLRMTGQPEDLPLILAEAQRTARSASIQNQDPALLSAALQTQQLSQSEQIPAASDARAGLDPRLQLRSGSLTLHDGLLPAGSLGLGSRRLLAMAIQRAASSVDQNVLVIDEIEYGLEPHRLRGLLSRLRQAGETGTQAFVTTHSPVALQNVAIDEVAFVKSGEGRTQITMVPRDLADPHANYQRIARSAPSALLAERVVVCEGATEKGISWAVLDSKTDPAGASSCSVAVMQGGSTKEALRKAALLADIGYTTAALVDGDHELTDDDVAGATTAGVSVVYWKENANLELRLFRDIPTRCLDTYVSLAASANAFQAADASLSIVDQVQSRLGNEEGSLVGGSPSEWMENGVAEDPLREALAIAAHKRGWFKQEHIGYRLGIQICEDWDAISGTDLRRGLDLIRSFISDG